MNTTVPKFGALLTPYYSTRRQTPGVTDLKAFLKTADGKEFMGDLHKKGFDLELNTANGLGKTNLLVRNRKAGSYQSTDITRKSLAGILAAVSQSIIGSLTMKLENVLAAVKG